MRMKSPDIGGLTVAVLVATLPWGCAPVETPHVNLDETVSAPAQEKDEGLSTVPNPGPSNDIGRLLLRFEPGQTATYTYSRENTRLVEWRGVSEQQKAKLRSGISGRTLEMDLTERIEGIDDQGRAAVEVTIDRLRYRIVGGQRQLDFNSSGATHQGDSALADLVGKTYDILKTPAGGVHRVIDSGAARGGLDPNKPDFDIALQLLADAALTERHSIKALVSNNEPQMVPGQAWIETQNFGFGQMGTRTFDKVYTYKGNLKESGASLALVEMSAVPSTHRARAYQERSQPSPFADVFADEYEFTGKLTLNTETGLLEHYSEVLEMRWAGVDPQSDASDALPASVHMTARQGFAYQRRAN